MTEFWRRWHMTLGTWFKDYIYIPLGGNRRGPRRMVFNTFVVWLFTGLWHGASWNFVIWGLVLFGIMMTEKFWTGKFFNKNKIAGHAYMIVIIPLTWLIFAVTDLEQLGIYFKRLIPFFNLEKGNVMKGDWKKSWETYKWFFLAGTVFSTKFPELVYKKMKNSVIVSLALLAAFWGAVYCMYRGLDDPFLYFRF